MSHDLNEGGPASDCPLDGKPCEGQGTDAECGKCVAVASRPKVPKPEMVYRVRGRRVMRYAIDLLGCCAYLHGAVTHSGGDYTADFVRGCLAARLADWTPSLPACAAYDDMVRALCEAAVREYDAWRSPDLPLPDNEQIPPRSVVEWSDGGGR